MAKTDKAKIKRVLFPVLALGLSVLATLVLVELALRITGFRPPEPFVPPKDVPVLYEPDPVLGWRSKTGRFRIPISRRDGTYWELTMLEGGFRATGPHAAKGDRPVFIIGGSGSQGGAVNDEEAFAWRLQERFPSAQFRNYATGAYGTYQALLLLEETLADETVRPAMVLYGFIEHHEARNVAVADWLETLSRLSQSGGVLVPYCTLGASGALERHPPKGLPYWPLRGGLVTVALLESLWVRIEAQERTAQRRLVTEKMILEMRDLSRARGAEFVLLCLLAEADTEAHYLDFARANGIRAIDCAVALTEDLQVPGDGHPNAKLHAIWAERIAKAIQEDLDGGDSGS